MDTPNNETRQRILDAADELFSKKGFAAVTLRDIGAAVGIKHASLYYYAPGGKEQLFMEVMERNLRRHQAGLTDAIARAPDDLRQQLYAVADWLVSQPPLDILRMVHADRSQISKDNSEAMERLMILAYDALRLPIVAVLEQAQQREQLRPFDLDLAALSLVSLVESLHGVPQPWSTGVTNRTAHALVDLLMDGLLKPS